MYFFFYIHSRMNSCKKFSLLTTRCIPLWIFLRPEACHHYIGRFKPLEVSREKFRLHRKCECIIYFTDVVPRLESNQTFFYGNFADGVILLGVGTQCCEMRKPSDFKRRNAKLNLQTHSDWKKSM